MDRQTIEDELSMPGAQELLTSSAAAHLAYAGQDGAPRVVPVGFFWTGDQVVISTATTAPKVTALSASADVALAIDGGATPDEARSLSIRGRASVAIVDGVVEEYLAAARQTMDAEAEAQFEQKPPDVQADGAHRDHAVLGSLLRFRRRPHASIPAGSGRTKPVVTVLCLASAANPTAQVILVPPGFENPQPSLGIELDSADAVHTVHAEAQRRGLRIVYPITDEVWGVRRFFVQDPGGTIINVLAHLR